MSHNNNTYAFKQLRKRILVRDEFTCQECGLEDLSGKQLHIDHIWPKALGGTDEEDNVRVLCVNCNLTKGARTPGDRIEYWNPLYADYR